MRTVRYVRTVGQLQQISGNAINGEEEYTLPFEPRYTISNRTAQNLMRIERANAVVEHLPLPVSVLRDLQQESRLQTVLLSTKIEGNRLTEAQNGWLPLRVASLPPNKRSTI